MWADADVVELVYRGPLFADRRDAGRLLACHLGSERGAETIVVGLARGGVVTASEVAAALRAPLDVVAVRKVGHPWQPEYAIGAVAPGGAVHVRARDGLTEQQVQAAVAEATARANELDALLHRDTPAADLRGKTCILVDDGLATGATMIATVRWARSSRAVRVVAAVPVAARGSLPPVEVEADAVVCMHALERFLAVGLHYRRFEQVTDGEVRRLLADGAAQPLTTATRPTSF